MPPGDDFASLMEGAGSTRALRKIRRGERVEGTVIALGRDRIFLDVGGGADAWIDRAELVDETGQLRTKVGASLSAVVVDPEHEEGPHLAVTLGQGAAGIETLQSARDANVAVEGVVKAANKGGLEIQIGNIRAFCPASHIESGRAEDLEAYVGRTLRFKVTELRSGSAVVSRRALLEEERRAEQSARLAALQVGAELQGTVTNVQRYGAFVDLGGVEGLIHISELANRRVERVEDIVSPGDEVSVRVLAIEEGKDGTRISLSMKALVAPEEQARPGRMEVLDAQVVELLPNAVLVETKRGSGMVRKRELDLSPGADHRRAYPVGTKLRVVLESADEHSGRMTFSMKRVAATEERLNFAEYAKSSAEPAARGMGTFGSLLADKLGLSQQRQTQERPDEPPPARDVAPRQPAPASSAEPHTERAQPAGVVRRKKR